MNISQKCQYALRALFELAKRQGEGPVSSTQIASVQAIPPRFLELILGQLRKGGFVESRRGINGGYLLVGPPEGLTVRQIVEFVDGPITPVRCLTEGKKASCPFKSGCAFMDMWHRATNAVTEVYESTTFRDLLEHEAEAGGYVATYCI